MEALTADIAQSVGKRVYGDFSSKIDESEEELLRPAKRAHREKSPSTSTTSSVTLIGDEPATHHDSHQEGRMNANHLASPPSMQDSLPTSTSSDSQSDSTSESGSDAGSSDLSDDHLVIQASRQSEEGREVADSEYDSNAHNEQDDGPAETQSSDTTSGTGSIASYYCNTEVTRKYLEGQRRRANIGKRRLRENAKLRKTAAMLELYNADEKRRRDNAKRHEIAATAERSYADAERHLQKTAKADAKRRRDNAELHELAAMLEESHADAERRANNAQLQEIMARLNSSSPRARRANHSARRSVSSATTEDETSTNAESSHSSDDSDDSNESSSSSDGQAVSSPGAEPLSDSEASSTTDTDSDSDGSSSAGSDPDPPGSDGSGGSRSADSERNNTHSAASSQSTSSASSQSSSTSKTSSSLPQNTSTKRRKVPSTQNLLVHRKWPLLQARLEGFLVQANDEARMVREGDEDKEETDDRGKQGERKGKQKKNLIEELEEDGQGSEEEKDKEKENEKAKAKTTSEEDVPSKKLELDHSGTAGKDDTDLTDKWVREQSLRTMDII